MTFLELIETVEPTQPEPKPWYAELPQHEGEQTLLDLIGIHWNATHHDPL